MFFSAVKTSAEDLRSSNYFEIIYILDGSATLLADGKEYYLSTSEGVIVAPSVLYGFPNDNVTFLRRSLSVKSELFLSAVNFVLPSQDLSNRFLQNKVAKFSLSSEELTFLENKLYNVYSYTDQDACRGFINLLSSIVIGQISFPNEETFGDDTEFTKKCLRLCHSFYTDNDANELVRKYFDYNDVYFGRKFKESFNCSLAEYINKLRIDTAVYFIINTNLTIEEICNDVGIYSIAYFIKLFKKHYGETPYKFRLSHRKTNSKRRTD